jgi:hypothetical protein
MKLRALLVTVGFVVSVQLPLKADTLWYNGDFDVQVFASNANIDFSGNPPFSNTYDDFVVPAGQQWSITNVFSNDQMTSAFGTTAYWEIRSGVSAGNGGTLVASGTGADTLTATGRTQFVFPVTYTEYTVEVSGLNVVLNSGTYWLTVAPILDPNDAGRSFVSITRGLNAVGTPPGNNGNSFFTNSSFGFNFTPLTDASEFGPGTWDISEGVRGTATVVSNVPEPASAVLLIAGLSGLGFFARRRGRLLEIPIIGEMANSRLQL